MDFYLSNGKSVGNLENYIKNYLEDHPNYEIFIGTDSQRKKRRRIGFVTTICFRQKEITDKNNNTIPGKGVHIIHKRINDKFTKDLFAKLWKEVEMSIETANEVCEYIDKDLVTIDLDLNSLKKWESNVAHDAAKGYVTGLGFKVRTKPDGWAATRASDHLSKK
jgi:predicted RNase H-related nuclease YkuK (DUF458 family)